MLLSKKQSNYLKLSSMFKKKFYTIKNLNFLLLEKKVQIKLIHKFNKNLFIDNESFKFLLFKNKLLLNALNSLFFKFLYDSLKFLKILNNSIHFFRTFYHNKLNQCAIVKAFFNFTNTFILLTNVKGEIKNWVSAGTGKFFTKLEKSVPQVPIALSFRISNIISRKKFKYIKLNYIGPSKRYRNKVYISLKNRSWVRGYKFVCVEEGYNKAFNGCRKRRLQRK